MMQNTKAIGKTLIFQLEGKLVNKERENLIKINELVANSDAERFAFDLEMVPFIDSTCIGSIVTIYMTALAKDATFALIKPRGTVLESLTELGVAKLFSIYDSEEEAVKASP